MSRRSRWLIAAAVFVCVLAGCSSYSEMAQIRNELVALGFDDAGVHVRHIAGTKLSEDRAEVVLLGGPMDEGAARDAAATLIWNELPVRFDTLLIEYQGEVTSASYAELEAQFGPRPEGLDDQSIFWQLASGFGALLAVPATILVVALVPVSVLIRRSRRKRRSAEREPGVGA